MNENINLITKLKEERDLTDLELSGLIMGKEADSALFQAADSVRREHYGDAVYVRGLIEFTNYCRNNCYYCGIRRDNQKPDRYRLTKEEILSCCEKGYHLGFRTFVLQGGEDGFYTDEKICDMIAEIRSAFPDCAITLSIGEKSRESYQAYFDAGADRYLLRHETATDSHYRRLHPKELSMQNRMQCLYNLKEIGYQVGAGFMVGSPYQTTEHLINDLRFLQKLSPDMIGIGPFISHGETPFSREANGTLSLTLRMLAIVRILFPHALLPATTALATIHPDGRKLGLKAGANVVMPNLSPADVRKQYTLYDNKICEGEEAAECKKDLEEQVREAGYQIVTHRGDVKR